MSPTKFTGIRSNRNPILRAFRQQVTKWPAGTIDDRVDLAGYWAERVASADPEVRQCWHMDAGVSQQVDAARVLYRYAEVFA